MEIHTEASLGRSSNGEGLVMVRFVHGWKNNAAFNNRNVEMFRGVLKELRKAEEIQSGLHKHNTRKIVGI